MSRLFAGIDVGGTALKYGLLDESGTRCFREIRACPTGAPALVEELEGLAHRLLAAATERGATLAGLGVACPGLIDPSSGRPSVSLQAIPGWAGCEIRERLEPIVGVPVAIDNDANAMLLAECRLGAARDVDYVLGITLGTGVGGAIARRGELWRGAQGAGGEFGHVVVVPDGHICECGRRGCLLTEVGVAAWQRDTAPQFDDGRMLLDAYASGNPTARSVINESLDHLARVLDGAVAQLDPDLVLIGGGVIDALPELASRLAATLRPGSWPASPRELEVRAAALGNDAGFIGAALLGLAVSDGEQSNGERTP